MGAVKREMTGSRCGGIRPLLAGCALASAIALLCASPADATSRVRSPVQFGAYDIPSVFHVSKSSNSNQVHYSLRLDEQCRPVGKKPVYAYWKKPTTGSRALRPLSRTARMVYGVSPKLKVTRKNSGGRITMAVKAVDGLRIRIAIAKQGERCVATPTVRIKGRPAVLDHAFVQLRTWNMGVRHVDVVAHRPGSGRKVVRRLRN